MTRVLRYYAIITLQNPIISLNFTLSSRYTKYIYENCVTVSFYLFDTVAKILTKMLSHHRIMMSRTLLRHHQMMTKHFPHVLTTVSNKSG